MKQLVTRGFIASRAALNCCAVIAALILGACDQSIDQSWSEPRGEARQEVVVRVGGGGARTLMPAALQDAGVSKYIITLTNNETITYTADNSEKIGELTGGGHSFSLAAGTWAVTAEAWREFDLDGPEGDDPAAYMAAAGTAVLEVTAGEANAVTVTLNPVAEADWEGRKGIFSWNMTLPSDDVTITAFTLGSASLSGRGNIGAIEVNAGIYDLSIVLLKGKLTGGLYETVYIYPGLETPAVFDFTTGDYELVFAENVPVMGTVNVTSSEESESGNYFTLTVYSDAGYQNAVTTVNGTDVSNPWTFEASIPAAYIGQTLYFKIDVSGAPAIHGNTASAILTSPRLAEISFVCDTRAILEAGDDVSAAWNDTSAAVTFTGASGLSLTGSDFTVTGGAAVSSAIVSDDTATVTISFAVNESADPKTYTVGIASGSAVIGGATSVTVTQGVDSRAELSAGSGAEVIEVLWSDTSAVVTFSGVSGLSLEASDFTASGGATVSEVEVAGDTAAVTITFAAKTSADTESDTSYTVGIAPDSERIRGDAAVTVTQERYRTAAITGTVTEGGTKPVEGVTVTLKQNGDDTGLSDTTDSDGNYSLTVPYGRVYTISVSKSGYESKTSPAFDVTSDTNDPIDLSIISTTHVYYNEPFDTLTDWEILKDQDADTVEIVADPDKAENNLLHINKTTGGSSSNKIGIYNKTDANAYGVFTVDTRVKRSVSVSGSNQFQIYTYDHANSFTNGDGANSVANIALDGGYIKTHGVATGSSTTQNVQPYAVDKWYTITLRVDTSAHTYDVYVNGAIRISGALFRTNTSEIDLFNIAAGNSGGGHGELWVDYIKVYQGEPQWLEGDKYTVTYDSGECDTPASPTGQVVHSAYTDCVEVMPTAPARLGYTFAGWQTTSGALSFTETTTVTENLTVIAQWTETAPTTLQVEFTKAGTHDVTLSEVGTNCTGFAKSDGVTAKAYNDSATESSHAAAEGLTVGAWIEFTFTLPANGTYTVLTKYRSGSRATAQLSIDGSNIGEPKDMSGTAAWNDWTAGTAELAAGSHTVRYTATDITNGATMRLDYLLLTPAD